MGLVVLKYKGLNVVEHSGGDAGYRSHLMRFPDQRFSVACLCNAGNANPSALARQVAGIYLAGQLVDEVNQSAPVAEVKLSEQQLAGKLGVYWNSNSADLARITMTNGRLFIAAVGGSSDLAPLGENRFRIKARPGEVSFELPKPGSAQRLILALEGSPPVIYEAVNSAAPTVEQLAEYSGAYYSDEIDSVYRVAVKEGKLTLLRKKFPPVSLEPAFADAFTTGSSLGTIRFTRDPQRHVTGFIAGSGRVRNLQFEKQPR
jgi:hypothetical protein